MSKFLRVDVGSWTRSVVYVYERAIDRHRAMVCWGDRPLFRLLSLALDGGNKLTRPADNESVDQIDQRSSNHVYR